MRPTLKNIAIIAPLALIGLGATIASDASAAAAHESIGVVLQSDDSHGHNGPNPYEQQRAQEKNRQEQQNQDIHIHIPSV
ncbi:hypothetical protein Srot_1544 [Segniliparus rotundus DSM 44985]|uniref:Secreted protein n=1 Tax=Segniliparus rotundus (strain ATCC BAA-972 / CDC 1076 / CIP 108378 / DSM 44985 / JCM 13578) TaxID=640132 RepID=D6Z7S7_SEGRD|nr:hypothetical protein [Segniliparus rotundus]ADG98007.1 hypothetical protein Srot_1544 [Segniliparus rotundus DSM 44985]